MNMNINFSSHKLDTKKILLICILLVLVVLKLFPVYKKFYEEKESRLSLLKTKLEYQEKIARKAKIIRQQYSELPKRKKDLEAKLFSGNSPELVNAHMRTELNKIALQNHIVIKLMNLPKFSRSGQWVLVTQSIVFNAEQQYLLSFISSIQNGKYFLPIVSLDIRHGSKNILHCSMKLVGFSKLTQQNDE